MTEDKKALNLGDFDFGFSLVDADELDEVKELKTQVAETTSSVDGLAGDLQEAQALAAAWEEQTDQWRQKANVIYKAIQPLLDNLSVDPDKEYIFWPGDERVAKINAFKLKLTQILED